MGTDGGIRFGQIFGIPLFVTPSWFIFVGLVAWVISGIFAEATGVSPGGAMVGGVLTALIVMATLLGHELGHALTARRYGIETHRITLFLLGGVAVMADEPRKPHEELWISLAGPAVSFVCAVLFGVGAMSLAALEALPMLQVALTQIAMLNLVFAVFSMLPGYPMDGGRVLRALLWRISGDYLRATRIAYHGGLLMVGLFALLGVVLMVSGQVIGLMYVVLALLLWRSTHAYWLGAQYRTRLVGLTVGQLMRPVGAVVPADANLARVVREYFARIHTDWLPVVQGRTLLGYIAAGDVARVPREQWDSLPAARLAKPYERADVVAPETDAMAVFEQLNNNRKVQFPVFSGQTLVGILLWSDLMAHLQGRAAGGRRSE